MAWRIPAIWKDLQKNVLQVPEGSTVPQKQKILLKAMQEVLTVVAEDMRQGLLETVGVGSSFSIDGESLFDDFGIAGKSGHGKDGTGN